MFHKHHRADALKFFFSTEIFRFSKEGEIMLVALKPGEVAKATIAPTAQGKPSNATLSAIEFDSTDVSVFTVSPDPDVPNGCIITGVGSGTATSAQILAKATATEPDGKTTEQVSGKDDVTCELLPPPPPVADGLVFTLTSPTPPPIPGQ